jgi:hypothetical protein
MFLFDNSTKRKRKRGNASRMNPLEIPGLLTFWDFQEAKGGEYVAKGPNPYRLRSVGKPVPVVQEGVFGEQSVRLGKEHGALHIPRRDCPALNLHGPKAQMSLIAWIKRERGGPESSCQAVAGMWNEHAKRQYCLFLNLRIWESAEQVGAHISSIGGATPGYKYCMDAAIGKSPVPFDQWQCVAISYDGTWAKSYLNGVLDGRGDRNPYRYDGGLFDGGPNGADFTVGAVTRPAKVDDNYKEHGSILANNYHGLLGGLAVYNRALTDDEIRRVAVRPEK